MINWERYFFYLITLWFYRRTHIYCPKMGRHEQFLHISAIYIKLYFHHSRVHHLDFQIIAEPYNNFLTNIFSHMKLKHKGWMERLSFPTVLFGDRSSTSSVLHVGQPSHWKYKLPEMYKTTELNKTGRVVTKYCHYSFLWWSSAMLSTKILTRMLLFPPSCKGAYSQFLMANDWLLQFFYYFLSEQENSTSLPFHVKLSNSHFSLFSHYLLKNHNHFQREKTMHSAAGTKQM